MIAVRRLAVRQGAFALADISFAVPAGRYAVLMGRSGAGKTTLLEAVAGLRPVSAGAVTLAGRDVTASRPAARGVGYVPQDGALFPTLTVRDNLAFALQVRRAPAAEVTRTIDELAARLGLAPLLDRFPAGLSGGERQRVALGRALAFRPPVLLLDEPLASLDDDTRDGLVGLLRGVRDRRDTTVLHVTHSRAEADGLADLVLRLENGEVRGGTRDTRHETRDGTDG